MKRKVYNKLVRDAVPDIIRRNNAVPKVSELDDEAFLIALKEKVIEEAGELLEAKNSEGVLGELADILQLVESIATAHGISLADVEQKKMEKCKERGGFEKRIFLEYVDE